MRQGAFKKLLCPKARGITAIIAVTFSTRALIRYFFRKTVPKKARADRKNHIFTSIKREYPSDDIYDSYTAFACC